MAVLTLYEASDPATALRRLTDPADIALALKDMGVDFERVEASLDPAALPLDLMAALGARYGFQTWDIVAIRPDTPGLDALRRTFGQEHTHEDPEARLFLAGGGSFYLRDDHRVAHLACVGGDLLHIPSGLRHWYVFPEDGFQALRLFSRTSGWQARYTGDAIAEQFAGTGP
jgi:1,2-dihydroxy-3-keto-5-methylthiopentene dioxygenase